MEWNGLGMVLMKIPSIEDEDISPKIWLRIPFLGKQGAFLVKRLIKKIQRNITRPDKFLVKQVYTCNTTINLS